MVKNNSLDKLTTWNNNTVINVNSPEGLILCKWLNKHVLSCVRTKNCPSQFTNVLMKKVSTQRKTTKGTTVT